MIMMTTSHDSEDQDDKREDLTYYDDIPSEHPGTQYSRKSLGGFHSKSQTEIYPAHNWSLEMP